MLLAGCAGPARQSAPADSLAAVAGESEPATADDAAQPPETGMCIAPEARAGLLACPGGERIEIGPLTFTVPPGREAGAPLPAPAAPPGERHVLEVMAERLLAQGQPSLRPLRALLAAQAGSPRRCHWRAMFIATVRRRDDMAELMEALRALADAAEEVGRDESVAAEIRGSCRANAAAALLYAASDWYGQAFGSADVPGSGNASHRAAANELSQLVLDGFEDLDALELPGERAWPRREEVRHRYATALYLGGDYERCGAQLDALAEAFPQRAVTYRGHAALCYTLAYGQAFRPSELMTRREGRARSRRRSAEAPAEDPRALTPLEAAMDRAFASALCHEVGADRATLLFQRARLAFVANRFDEAAPLFREVAWAHRDAELAPAAARLYLDALDALAARSPELTEPCARARTEAAAAVRSVWCADEESTARDPDLCEDAAAEPTAR